MAIREDVQAAEVICNTKCKANSRSENRAGKLANLRERGGRASISGIGLVGPARVASERADGRETGGLGGRVFD